jgi:hypothetical protein
MPPPPVRPRARQSHHGGRRRLLLVLDRQSRNGPHRVRSFTTRAGIVSARAAARSGLSRAAAGRVPANVRGEGRRCSRVSPGVRISSVFVFNECIHARHESGVHVEWFPVVSILYKLPVNHQGALWSSPHDLACQLSFDYIRSFLHACGTGTAIKSHSTCTFHSEYIIIVAKAHSHPQISWSSCIV